MYTRTGSKPILMMALVALIALLIGACAPATPVSPTDAPGNTPTVAPAEEATVAPTEEATEEPSAEAEEAEATATPAPEEEAAAEDSASTDTLEGVTWQLVEFLNTSDELTTAEADATLTFADGQASGSAGCNNFFAGYTIDGQQLTFEQAGSTMMACEEAIMAQEQAVLERLAQAASYEIVDGQLHILDADGNVLLAFTELEATALTGVTWVATNYNNGNQAVVARFVAN